MSPRTRAFALALALLSLAAVAKLPAAGASAAPHALEQKAGGAVGPKPKRTKASLQAFTQPVSARLTVVTKADLLSDDVGARLTLYVNGKPVSVKSVANPSWQSINFTLAAPLKSGDRVDLLFNNDAADSRGDRNVWVREISEGATVRAAEVATYDKGSTYATATDGKDVAAATQVMPWNGAMRFTWASATAPVKPAVPAAPGPRQQATRTSGPIVAKTGQTIRGQRISCGTETPAILVPPGVNNVTIEDNVIGPCGPGVVGILADRGSYSLTVRHNLIHGVASGMWARHTMHPIDFQNNVVYDILGPFPRGQMIQLDNVTQGSGQTRIVGNVSDWFARTRTTSYEDHINLYMSRGTSQQPILIQGNRLRGGDSDSGSGIVVGDQGGQHVKIDDNVVIAVPNTGIGLAGGSNLSASRNRIYNVHGPLLRTRSAFYVWNVDQVVLRDNRAIASYCGVQNYCDLHMGFWFGPNSTNVIQSNNDWFDKTLSPRIWSEVWTSSGWVPQ